MLVTGQLWSLISLVCRVRLRIQLNSVLFAKTLVRKDVASSANSHTPSSVYKSNNPSPVDSEHSEPTPSADADGSDEPGEFSSKAQIMTLMTTDVDRVSEFSTHAFTLVGMCHTLHLFFFSLEVLNLFLQMLRLRS